MSAPDWIPYCYPTTFREKRNAHPRRAIVRDQIAAWIPRVNSESAPVAFEISRRGHAVLWRVVDGVLMRDVLDAQGAPGGVDVLASSAMNFANSSSIDHAQIRSMLYAMLVEAPYLDEVYDQGRFGPGLQAYSGRDIVSVETGGKIEAQSQAQAFAETLALVDGRLMMPAPEPVLIVGLSPNAGPLCVEISPGIIGHDFQSHPHAAFRIDMAGEAEAFAAEYAAQARVLVRRNAGVDRGDAVVVGGESRVIFRDEMVYEPSEMAQRSPLAAFSSTLSWKFRDVALKSLPPFLVAGYGTMVGALAPGRIDVGRAVQGYEMVRDAAGDLSWPILDPAWMPCIEASISASRHNDPDCDADLDLLPVGITR